MNLLIRLKFYKESIEGTEVLEDICSVHIKNYRERKTEQEVVGGSASQLSCIKVGHFSKVGFAEKKSVEPIHTAFMPTWSLVGSFCSM